MKKLFLSMVLCSLIGACSKTPTGALVRVEAEGNTCWTGSFDGMYDGCGNAEFELVDPRGKFSAFVQKVTDDGLSVRLSLIIDGQVADSASGNVVSGPYGIYVKN